MFISRRLTKEEATTSKVKQEKDSEQEGTFENNQEDEMDRKDISIPVFDGENYRMWKKRIQMFMKFKKWEIVIEREKTETDKVEKWTQNDLKAINIIYSAISDEQLEFVSEEETVYKIIKLDSMYL